MGKIIAPKPFKGYPLLVPPYSLGQGLLTDVLQAGSLEGPGSGGWQALQLCCVEQVSLRSAGLQRWLTQWNHQSCSCSPELPPSACSGSSLAEELFWHGFFPVPLLPELCLCGAPGEAGSPWQRLGISLIPDGSGLEPQAGGQSIQLPNWLSSVGEPPLGSWKWPQDVSSQLV